MRCAAKKKETKMKKISIYNYVRRMWPLCIAALLASCGLVEIEHSKNGKLDGYWHLVTVDTLDTGGQLDLRQERFFWIVQGTVFQLYCPDVSNGQRYVSHFSYENENISFQQFYYDRREQGDPILEKVEMLQPFGINQLAGESFVIEELSGGNMTLRGDALRLVFKKH